MDHSKSNTAKTILSAYMDYILTHNKRPESVYIFTKNLDLDEAAFYAHYNSFEFLEKQIFNAFFKNTHDLLSESKDFASFDARNKLLSFYFTFFELLTANRSYVIYALHQHKNKLKSLDTLSILKQNFGKFMTEIGIEKMELLPDAIQKLQGKSITELAWLQLLLTMQFWINDTSPSFEKTDVFIEKAINTSFDVFDSKPFKSILDLGKFLFQEKSNFNM